MKIISIFYILKNLPGDTRQAGRATVKSFGVRSRFVHFEFFRLLKDQEGLGRKGDLVGLEVNMRPCGGFTPDMMDFAGTTDVYKIWADMIAYDRTDIHPGERKYCAFAGRRGHKDFVMSHEDIMKNTETGSKCRTGFRKFLPQPWETRSISECSAPEKKWMNFTKMF